MSSNHNTKVVIAMSGGVDSSVSAALLKEAGFNVVGVFMRCWNADDFLQGECSAEEDEYWARRAASQIGIPFYSFDLVDDYKSRVVDYFVSEYRAGRTPNPDVMCNEQIKFGVFFDKVINELGMDKLATGHYARVKKDKNGTHLLKGLDPNKDQTYFLYRVGADKLSRTMFPIGDIEKSEVRKLARQFSLPNAEKKDSQGICFIGKVDIGEFLAQYIPQKPGEIVKLSGEVIGKHDGVHNYTIGQRKGIGIGGGIPYYVVGKDLKENKVIVSTEYDEKLFSQKLRLSEVTWINKKPKLPHDFEVSIRYRQQPQPATISEDKNNILIVEFKEPQRAVTAGQSAVLYDGEEVLGGGIIV